MNQLDLFILFDEFRAAVDDEDSPRVDAILDAMDIIWGYCGRHARLYDTDFTDEELEARRREIT